MRTSRELLKENAGHYSRQAMAYQTVNPFNGKLVRTFPEQSDTQVDALLDRAGRCFQEKWRETGFAERAAVVHGAASILRSRADEFARLDLGITEFMNKKLICVAS